MRDKFRFRPPARPSWRFALVGALVAALCAFAAATLTASGAGDRKGVPGGHARFQRFRSCMSAHGVKPPRERGERPSRDQLRSTLSACRRYLPRRAQRELQRRERFRSCMSRHGVQPPREGGPRPDRRTLRHALRACGEYAPRHGNCGPGRRGRHPRFGAGPLPPPDPDLRMGSPPAAG